MGGRPFAAALMVLAAAGVGGCYASTEPATNIGPDSATLNARGTANDGPATSHFEYWRTGSAQRLRTRTLHWPADASGPISDRASGLSPSTSYSFRVCGSDDDQTGDVCANTQTFTTTPPPGDRASGGWFFSASLVGSFDAGSDPNGGSPGGTVRTSRGCAGPGNQECVEFIGTVTCLAVSGNRAAIGAVGTEHVLPANVDRAGSRLVTVVDGGSGGTDTWHDVEQASATPPNCATASFASQEPLDPRLSSVVVVDVTSPSAP